MGPDYLCMIILQTGRERRSAYLPLREPPPIHADAKYKGLFHAQFFFERGISFSYPGFIKKSRVTFSYPVSAKPGILKKDRNENLKNKQIFPVSPDFLRHNGSLKVNRTKTVMNIRKHHYAHGRALLSGHAGARGEVCRAGACAGG